MRKFVIFYSWQSDLPNSTNRGFIQKALEKAAKSISRDVTVDVEPVIDRDTIGVPGAPDIANTIFKKIEEADVFLCDISIINKNVNSRPTPNPNVLLELGFALKALGHEKIILVLNREFGSPDLLPFDLRLKRVIEYCVKPENGQKAQERNKLTSLLEQAVRTIVDQMKSHKQGDFANTGDGTLKSESEAIIESQDMSHWRSYVAAFGEGMCKELIKWSEYAHECWSDIGQEGRIDLRFDAVEKCLPAFIPILTAAEKGDIDMWQDAVNPIRSLVLTREEIQSQFVDVTNMGSHMLYFIGNLGIALATRARHLNIVNAWMSLPMPSRGKEEVNECKWWDFYEAHRIWGIYEPNNTAPFDALLRVCESDHLSPFGFDTEQPDAFFYIGNLLQSICEMQYWLSSAKWAKLSYVETERLALELNVWPAWVLMQAAEFQSNTWELFRSADGIYQYLFHERLLEFPEDFWESWKLWKNLCIQAVTMRDTDIRAVRDADLVLPGEPSSI